MGTKREYGAMLRIAGKRRKSEKPRRMPPILRLGTQRAKKTSLNANVRFTVPKPGCVPESSMSFMWSNAFLVLPKFAIAVSPRMLTAWSSILRWQISICTESA